MSDLQTSAACENADVSPTCVSSSVCFQVRALSVDFVAPLVVASVYPPLPLGVRGLHRQRSLPGLHYDRRMVPSKAKLDAKTLE